MGGAWGIMIVNEDVSELTGVIRKHRVVQKQLESQREYLKNFAAAAGHDLRGPLRQISALSSLVEDLLQQECYSDALSTIQYTKESAQKLDVLIRDLINHAKASEMEPGMQVDLNEIVEEVISRFDSRSEQAKFEVLKLPPVLGSRPALLQLFQNLIGNAIKYRGKQSPRVRISSEALKESVQLCVQDNGLGIEANQLDSIFRPFKRLHPESEIPGSGLGLATCRRIVELHGGRIWAASEPGSGCRFYFTLPREGNRHLVMGA